MLSAVNAIKFILKKFLETNTVGYWTRHFTYENCHRCLLSEVIGTERYTSERYSPLLVHTILLPSTMLSDPHSFYLFRELLPISYGPHVTVNQNVCSKLTSSHKWSCVLHNGGNLQLMLLLKKIFPCLLGWHHSKGYVILFVNKSL